ncbi:MAG: hypothetical protein JNL39_13375 [Opitutaceae bacterium]|nr:hypothetical protein [Opitutaceae bacterium]
MKPLHLVLGASLAANVLAVVAYFHARSEADKALAYTDGSALLAQLALTPAQTNRLAETRRRLRADLGGLRAETAELFDAAITKFREATPGDTSYEAAIAATGEVRRRQTLVIVRELVAFREQLRPAQRELFNRHIGDWSFIEAVIGLPPDIMRGPPSGPFRAAPSTPSAPLKNGR